MNTAKPVMGMVLKGYPRISETFISNEILLLESLGLSLRLFSMRKPRENFSHESVKKIQARVDYLPTELLIDLHRNILILHAERCLNRIRCHTDCANSYRIDTDCKLLGNTRRGERIYKSAIIHTIS